jgi:hypothetical protein
MTDLNNILMHVPAGNEFADINESLVILGAAAVAVDSVT